MAICNFTIIKQLLFRWRAMYCHHTDKNFDAVMVLGRHRSLLSRYHGSGDYVLLVLFFILRWRFRLAHRTDSGRSSISPCLYYVRYEGFRGFTIVNLWTRRYRQLRQFSQTLQSSTTSIVNHYNHRRQVRLGQQPLVCTTAYLHLNIILYFVNIRRFAL